MPNSYGMHEQWVEYQNSNPNGNLPEILVGDVEESSSAMSNS
ncbi:hypothetical protein T01_11880 [Trichinella spiralis]|uniref:Uncharacterized protein n=1 Tax=Trichinella spiralis TaxID=6334 RepID=A0A0V0YVB3_TRISP|nr:hypothetical protein T01_11880 [Trichinella spiralis]